jgi:hypothetical protein
MVHPQWRSTLELKCQTPRSTERTHLSEVISCHWFRKWANLPPTGIRGKGVGKHSSSSGGCIDGGGNMSVTRDPNGNLLLQEEAHTNLQKGAVELVNPPLTPSFYSRLFLVPKKNGKMRPVIDLSPDLPQYWKNPLVWSDQLPLIQKAG